jgi:hypothetical protein
MSSKEINNLKQTPINTLLLVSVFLMGGGSLVGADLENMLTERVGFQVGAGLVGFGCGIKPAF